MGPVTGRESQQREDSQALRGGRRGWRAGLVRLLVNAVVVGAAVNILSGDYRWRFVALAAAVGFALAVPGWLRHVPPRSILATWTTPTLIAGAVAASAFATLSPPRVGSWEIIATALPTASAVLVSTEYRTRLVLLGGVAMIVTGVAIAGGGYAVLDHYRAPGLGAILCGFFIALCGFMLNSNSRLISVRASTIGQGRSLTRSARRGAILVIGWGVIFALIGTMLVGGAARLLDETPGTHRSAFIAVIAVGIAFIGGGAAVLTSSVRLAAGLFVGSGIILVGGGVALLTSNARLASVALTAAGIAVTGYGLLVALDNGLDQLLRNVKEFVSADRPDAAAIPEGSPDVDKAP